METNTLTVSAVPHRARRHWLWLLLLPAGVLAWLLLSWQQQPLRLIARHTVPTEWWLNCGVLSHLPVQQLHYQNTFDRETQQLRYPKDSVREVVWLDALGNTQGTTRLTVGQDASISPEGQMIAAVMPNKSHPQGDHDYKVTFDGRDSTHSEIAPSPLRRNKSGSLSGLTDAGAFSDYFGGVFLRDGTPVSLPRDGRRYQLAPTACSDAHYLPLLAMPPQRSADYYDIHLIQLHGQQIEAKRAPEFPQFKLYDLTRQQCVFSMPVWKSKAYPEVVFHDGTRFVCAGSGAAGIFEDGKRLASFTGDWQWCGDGTIWQPNVNNGEPVTALHILHWRTGRPDVVTVPVQQTPGQVESAPPPRQPRSALPGTRFLGTPAAWADGTLIARLESAAMPTDLTAGGLHPASAPRNTIQLALYHAGARISAFTLDVTPSPIFTDHLSFSPDGHALYWAFRDDGGQRLYVFRVK